MFKVGDVVKELYGFKNSKNDIKIGDIGVVIEVRETRVGEEWIHRGVVIRYFDGQVMLTNEDFFHCIELVKSNEQ